MLWEVPGRHGDDFLKGVIYIKKGKKGKKGKGTFQISYQSLL